MSLVTKCLEMGLNLTVEELVSLSLDALMKEICKQKQTDVIPESVWIQIKDLRRLYLNRVSKVCLWIQYSLYCLPRSDMIFDLNGHLGVPVSELPSLFTGCSETIKTSESHEKEQIAE